MISLDGTMSNPVSRGTPLMDPPRPTTMSLRNRSFMSMTRRQVILRGSMLSGLP